LTATGASASGKLRVQPYWAGNINVFIGIHPVERHLARTLEALGKNGAVTLPTDVPSSFWHGLIDDVRIYNRVLSLNEVAQLYAIESGPLVDLIKAVKPSFSYLALGTNYQLQVSGNLSSWTNQGSVFTATNTSMVYPQYWDVDNWNELFFRLQVAP